MMYNKLIIILFVMLILKKKIGITNNIIIINLLQIYLLD